MRESKVKLAALLFEVIIGVFAIGIVAIGLNRDTFTTLVWTFSLLMLEGSHVLAYISMREAKDKLNWVAIRKNLKEYRKSYITLFICDSVFILFLFMSLASFVKAMPSMAIMACLVTAICSLIFLLVDVRSIYKSLI